MNWTRLLNGLWIGIAAFFIARCVIIGINPLLVGFFVAICLAGENSFCGYIGGVIGLLTAVPLVDCVRYGLVMLFISGMLNVKQLLVTKGKELYICLYRIWLQK